MCAVNKDFIESPSHVTTAVREPMIADVAKLQQQNGSFAGDSWGEIDTRFSYCALNCLWLVNRMSAIDVDRAADYVFSCRNFDGGFGATPGNESHAGQVFTCVATLHLAGRLDLVDSDLLCWWSVHYFFPVEH